MRYGGEEVIWEDVDMINGVKEMEKYWNVSWEKVMIRDMIGIGEGW